MNTVGFLIIGMSTALTSPLLAGPPETSGNGELIESAYLKKHEKNLERMKAQKSLDTEETRQALELYLIDKAEMSVDAEELLRDILELRSVEEQVVTAQKQLDLTFHAYKECVLKYGLGDPITLSAYEKWKEGKLVMDSFYESRVSLKKDIRLGGRQVHNEKTLLSIQKRDMDSRARYRAIDNRKLEKEVKTIANEREAMSQTVRSTESSRVSK